MSDPKAAYLKLALAQQGIKTREGKLAQDETFSDWVNKYFTLLRKRFEALTDGVTLDEVGEAVGAVIEAAQELKPYLKGVARAEMVTAVIVWFAGAYLPKDVLWLQILLRGPFVREFVEMIFRRLSLG